jgi:hypothetical protein
MYTPVLDKLCKIYEKYFLWVEDIDFPMEPRTLGLLVAILFFLISFLVNLLQRRYSRTRLRRMLEKEKSVINLLGVIDEYLNELEFTCTFDVYGKSSPREVGKAIHMVRNKIQATIANIGEHLYSFRQYRGNREMEGKTRRRLKKIHHRTSRRWQHGNI